MKLKILYTVLLVISASMLFADGFTFQSEKIEIKGVIDEIIIQDVNNDKIPELVIQNNRTLLIFKLEPGKAYHLPANILTLPDDIFIYDIADGLFGITPDGVVRSDLVTATNYTRILETPTIFQGKLNDAPLYKRFIYPDLGLFIPGPGSFSLAQPAGNQYAVSAHIAAPVKTSVAYNELSVFEPVSTQTSLPKLEIIDINGDGKNDIVTLTANEIKYYLNGSKWEVGSAIPVKSADSNDINIIAPVIRDINGDNKADIITTDGSEGAITIYLSPDFQDPAQIIRTGNWIVSNDLIDLNSDGLQDLVLVQMKKLGVLGGLQAFLAHSVNWEIVVYLARPDKGFPKSPDYIREFNVPFTLNISGSGNISGRKAVNYNFQTPYLWSFSGDFNKDGLKDLLISTADSPADRGKLQIYPGAVGRVFDQAPKYEIALESVKDGFKLVGMPQGEPIISDLNNDGVSDIIIQLVNQATNATRLEIFIPGNWLKK
jgi:hypothetical protein